MDVKTAFLNGHIWEEIFMDQPEGEYLMVKNQKCASWWDLYMAYSKHHAVGTFVLMRQSNRLASHKIWMNLVFTKRLVGALLHF